MKLICVNDYYDMCRNAANIISAQVILNPNSVLGLATGATPVGIYQQLIQWYEKGDLDFSTVKTVNLDEYCGLPPTSPQSFAYYMHENFFSKVNIPLENTHIPNGMNPDEAMECHRYNQLIRSLCGIDLQLLGLGHNGHIGFNEPGQAFEKETHCVNLTVQTKKDNRQYFDSPSAVPCKAYTVGIKTIMNARRILLVVTGPHKADVLFQALTGPISPALPASILQLHNNVTIVADKSALTKIVTDADYLLR